MTAQAVDEEIGCGLPGKCTLQFPAIGRIDGENFVRFAGESFGRFFGRNQAGDLRPITAKKIRASFTGVTATGDEDARSV